MKKEYTAPKVIAKEENKASSNIPNTYEVCRKGQYSIC